jgi:hypothetical protein
MPKGVFQRGLTPIQRALVALLNHPPDSVSSCWLWDGYLSSNGYAMLGGKKGKKGIRVHRLMFEHFFRKVPEGMELDHLCRVRRCVNPTHLEIVTHKENMRRGFNGRKTHCLRGHPLTGDNLRIIRSTGARQCLTCKREREGKCRQTERKSKRTPCW